jgi:hypothetical protein
MNSHFDSKLLEIIESHPSIIVGTCDKACVPSISRGFGGRVSSTHPRMEILVSHWPGPECRANLEQTKRIAVTFTSPETFEAYQVKGKVIRIAECDHADLDLLEIYTRTIQARITALGEPLVVARVTFTSRGLFRVSFEVDSVFVQTPGTNAGRQI